MSTVPRPRSSKLDALAARYGIERRVEDDAQLRQRIEHAVTGIQPGTFASIDAAMSDALDWVRPVSSDPLRLKRQLALRWLAKPEGFWRRTWWALKLAWRDR